MNNQKHDLTPLFLEDDEWNELQFHELCTFFPEMVEEDYESLKSSMSTNGFLKSDPIVVVDMNEHAPVGTPPDYRVLDGRNRFLAALDTATKPEFLQYVGDDPLGFVLSRNLGRRHLNTGQKAALAAKLATIEQGGNQFREGGVTQSDAAAIVGIGEATLRRYRYVERMSPSLAEQVANGTLPLEKARSKAQRIKAEQDNSAEQTIKHNGKEVLPEPESDGTKVASEPDADPDEGLEMHSPSEGEPGYRQQERSPDRGDSMGDIDPTKDCESLVNPIQELISRARKQGWDTLADAAEGEYHAMMNDVENFQ